MLAIIKQQTKIQKDIEELKAASARQTKSESDIGVITKLVDARLRVERAEVELDLLSGEMDTVVKNVQEILTILKAMNKDATGQTHRLIEGTAAMTAAGGGDPESSSRAESFEVAKDMLDEIVEYGLEKPHLRNSAILPSFPCDALQL